MERTLFVFEGEGREKQYFQSLERAFFSGEESRILISFQNDIYELYKQLSEDEDLDPFEVIRELNPTVKNQAELIELRRDQISQIYLFFDMEPQDDLYSDEKLLSMIDLFNNETENGKLFISYPMIEAIRDIDDHDEYLSRTVDLASCTGRAYKRLSSERASPVYQDARKIDKPLWQGLISVNVKKANGLIWGDFSLTPVIDQRPVTQAQLDNYLPKEQVAVLSAFPIFLADYFGSKVFEL